MLPGRHVIACTMTRTGMLQTLVVFSMSIFIIVRSDAVTTTGYYFGKDIVERNWPGAGRDGYVFTKVPCSSLENCKGQCNARGICSAVFYVRRWAMCYILADSRSNLETQKPAHELMAKTTGAVLGVKAEWPGGANSSSLLYDNSTECGPPPDFHGAKRLGNMYQTGSKVKYMYQRSRFNILMTCGSNGLWQHLDAAIISQCNQTEYSWLRNDSCYIVEADTEMNYTQAKSACQGYGGHLVTIANQREQTFIEDLLKQYVQGLTKDQRKRLKVNPAFGFLVYIGLTDGPPQNGSKNRNFTWSDNSATDFENWKDDDPKQNDPNELCVVIGPKSRKWEDVNCDRSFYALCEIDL